MTELIGAGGLGGTESLGGMGGIMGKIPLSVKILFLTGTGFILSLMSMIILAYIADNIRKSSVYKNADEDDSLRRAYALSWQCALASGLFCGLCLGVSVGLVIYLLKTGQ